MKKLFFVLITFMFTIFLVACEDVTGEQIPDEYKNYFNQPQGQEVDLELEDLLELVANATVETVTDNTHPIIKLSTAGLLQLVMNTEAQTEVPATNNSLYFDFAQTSHIQLGAYTDDIRAHVEVSKFDFNMDFDLMSMYMAAVETEPIDIDFTGGFYISSRYAYYRVNLNAEIFGQETSIEVKEKINDPLPHEAINLPEAPEMPIELPELGMGDEGTMIEFLTDELIAQIKTFKQNNDYTIDITFNKQFVVTFVTNLYNEAFGNLDLTQEELEELVPSLEEILGIVNDVVKTFNLRMRLEIKGGKFTKVAFYANVDIDFVKSQHVEKFEELEEVPISRIKLLLDDYFYAIEYVNTFPQFPDFSSYTPVDIPSIVEMFEDITLG